MTHRSRLLQREEKLALLCSLIMTGALAMVLQHLKEGEDAETRVGKLANYEEFFAPTTRKKLAPEGDQLRSRSRTRNAERSVVIGAGGNSAEVVQTESGLPPNKSAEKTVVLWDSTTSEQSDVFRNHKPDIVLNSIFKSDPTTRWGLLRQHLQYSASIYDTVPTLHLVRLSQVIRRFDDQPVTLEESMRRNLRRYGHSYHPVRPEPVTAQVPLEGILFRLLGYVF